MRTGLFLLVGFLLMAAAFILGRLFTANFPAAMWVATITFIVVWCGIAAFNLWVGVTHAGYSLAEETPIFLLLAGVPAIVAAVLKWKVV